MHHQNKQTRQRNRLAIFLLSNIYFLCKWVCLKARRPLSAGSEHYSYSYPFFGNNNILTFNGYSVKEKNEKIVNFSRNDAILIDLPSNTAYISNAPLIPKFLNTKSTTATFVFQAQLENNTQPQPIVLYITHLSTTYRITSYQEELLCSI